MPQGGGGFGGFGATGGGGGGFGGASPGNFNRLIIYITVTVIVVNYCKTIIICINFHVDEMVNFEVFK